MVVGADSTSATDDTAARLAQLRAEYERLAADAAAARSQFLSDRLTRTRKEAQLREAQIEEADDQADYFAGRAAEMAGIVAHDEERIAALEGRAEGMRGDILTLQIEDALAQFAAAVAALAPKIAAISEELTATANRFIQAAEGWADELPPSARDAPRSALTAATDRYIALEGLLHDLGEAVGSQ